MVVLATSARSTEPPGKAEGVMYGDRGVTDIAVVYVDQHGRTEVLWGAGALTTAPDHLYVVHWPA